MGMGRYVYCRADPKSVGRCAGRRGQVQVVVTAGQEGSGMTGESWQGKQSRYMRKCGGELADTSSFKSALRDEKGT